MEAKCKKCNKHAYFHTRRGFSLKDQRCKCGGTYQRANFSTLPGVNPITKISDYEAYNGEMHIVYVVNGQFYLKDGELMVLHPTANDISHNNLTAEIEETISDSSDRRIDTSRF